MKDQILMRTPKGVEIGVITTFFIPCIVDDDYELVNPVVVEDRTTEPPTRSVIYPEEMSVLKETLRNAPKEVKALGEYEDPSDLLRGKKKKGIPLGKTFDQVTAEENAKRDAVSAQSAQRQPQARQADNSATGSKAGNKNKGGNEKEF